MLHKQGMMQSGFVGDHLIGAFFIDSEFLDELEHQASLLGLGWTDV
jgi:hypothetical protein